MDALLIALAWILGIVVIVTPVIAIAAFVRSREVKGLQRRVDDLERRIARMRSEQARSSGEDLQAPREQNEAPGDIRPAPTPTPALPARPAASSPGPPPVPAHLQRPARASGGAAEGTSPAAEPQSPPGPAAPPRPGARPEPAARPALAPTLAAGSAAEAGAPRGSRPPGQAPATATPAEPKAAIDWEMWLGVRGAAIVGGISLVLAGLFFFQYAVAHGYFSPGLRILVGSVLGIVCMLAKGTLAKRDLRVLSDVLAGAGAVILYGAAWASFQLYGFVPMPVAFAWMAAVTVLTGILAVRHDSQLIALFGLVGGFATPLLLSTGTNRPISLFGYVLLLDIGLLALARRRGWPLLGVFGILGTTVLQGLWVVARMGPDQAQLGLGILGVFAILFAVGASGSATGSPASRGESGERDKRTWFAAQLAGVLVPFLFGLYFAANVDIGPSLTPLALLLGLLVAAACWVSRAQQRVELALGSAVAAVGVCLAWTLNQLGDAPVLWSVTLAAIGITLILVVFKYLPGVRDRHNTGKSWFERPEAPAAAAIMGFLATLFVAASSGEFAPALAPLATGCAVLGVLAFVLDIGGLLRFLPLLVSLAIGAVMAVFAAQESDFGFRDAGPVPFGATLALFAIALLAAGTWRRGTDLGRRLSMSVVPLVAPTLLALEPWQRPDPTQHLWLVLALATLAAVGAARAGSGIAYGALVIAAVGGLTRWNIELYGGGEMAEALPAALALQAGALALLAWLPALGRRLLPLDGWVLRAALASTVLWAVPINWLQIDEVIVGDATWRIFAALAAIAGVGAALLRWREGGSGAEERKLLVGARVLSTAVAAMFASFSLAHLTDIEWVPVGLALSGLAWAAIARGWSHKKLSVAGSVALLGAAALLGLLAFVPGYFDTSASLVFNPLAVAYLVPAACALACLAVNPGRAGGAHPFGGSKLRAIVGGSGVLLVFAWLNLGVLNAFETGPSIRFDWERVQDRDLTQSLVWGMYSLVLVGIGTARRIDGLRWMSLGFQIVTIGKVFLYDLGELTGLYRAGSMMGLAVCLLLVSLLYQRVVFRKPSLEE